MRTAVLVLAAAVLALPVAAQGTLVSEDFESNAFPPAGWTLYLTVPPAWTVLNPGECGSITRSASFGQPTPAGCNYWTPWAAGGELFSPPFTPSSSSATVEFDYRLSMDPSGDTVDLSVEDQANPGVYVPVAGFSSFLNDGLQHHAVIPLPVTPGSSWTLHFSALSDGVGDQLPGWRFDDVVIRDGPPVQASCFGDGSGTPCPCGNPGAPGEGCANSSGSGAVVGWSGTTSVAADDLVLTASQLGAFRLTILFEGVGPGASGGTPFKDGLLCVATPLRRLATATSSSTGVASFGPGLLASAGWTAGTTHRAQVWYRDGNGPCGRGSNLSHQVSVAVLP
jgi:hypothetical protein